MGASIFWHPPRALGKNPIESMAFRVDDKVSVEDAANPEVDLGSMQCAKMWTRQEGRVG